MTRITRRLWLPIVLIGLILVGCESHSNGKTEPPSSQEPSYKLPTETVLVQGTVTFDQIPRDPQTGRLNPAAAYPMPVRSAQIDAMDDQGHLLYSTVSSKTGTYTVLVPAATIMTLRVWAKIEDTMHGAWRAQVVDNTKGYGAYAMISSPFNSGSNSHRVDLHAASGYGTDAYETTRISAPFAILDAIHDGFDFAAEQDQRTFPPLTVAWSPRNSTAKGAIEAGQIGTSFYLSQNKSFRIFLLGNIHNDADDYDRSVILHEFSHYLIEQVSRNDSLGGIYGQSTQLDMRVSFNEAISNVLAMAIEGQSTYFDSTGDQLSAILRFDLEAHQNSTPGWYNTEALSWLLYDLYDGGNKDDDPVALGWDGFYTILTNPDILVFDGVMSIFPFLQVAEELYPEQANAIRALANRQNIVGGDAYGANETDNANSELTLPLYYTYESGPLNVCSDNQNSDYNGADVHRLIRFNVEKDENYIITVTRQGGTLMDTNPDFDLYLYGKTKASGSSSEKDREQISTMLSQGQYLLDVFERDNADNVEGNGGLACFDVTISPGELNNAPPASSCDNLAARTGDIRCQQPNPIDANRSGALSL